MKSLEERVAAAERELKLLRERHSKAEAKWKRDEAQQARRDEKRRKELAGSMILELVRTGVVPEASFRKWLDGSVTDLEDRALFGP